MPQPEHKTLPATSTRSLTLFQRITGTGLNPEIAQDSGWFQFLLACLIDGGMTTVMQKYLSLAKKSKYGVVQSWIGFSPLFFITDPGLSYQVVKTNNRNLVNSEADGVQERIFGKDTVISLDKYRDKELYDFKRKQLLNYLFHPIADLVSPMQRIFSRILSREFAKAAKEGVMDPVALSKNMAFTAIGEIQLGFFDIDEDLRKQYDDIVLKTVYALANPIYILIFKCQKVILSPVTYCQQRISNTVTWLGEQIPASIRKQTSTWIQKCKPCVPEPAKQWGKNTIVSLTACFAAPAKNILNRMPQPLVAKAAQLSVQAYEIVRYPLYVDRLAARGEKILLQIIKKNKFTTLEKMKGILNNPQLTVEDLVRGESLSTMKLFLTGGYDTTSKTVLSILLMLLDPDPANGEYVKLMRAEKNAIGLPPVQWKRQHIESLKYITAFMHENFRVKPSFSIQRNSAESDFILITQDGSNFFVPAGAIFLRSVIDMNRNKKKWGDDADKFNPARMLTKNIDIRTIHGREDFATFGNDDRVCPGRRFAEQEGILIIAMLLELMDLYEMKIIMTRKVNGIAQTISLEEALSPGITLELKPGVEVRLSVTPKNSPEHKPSP